MSLQDSLTFARLSICRDLVAAVAVAHRSIVSGRAVRLAAEGGTGWRVHCMGREETHNQHEIVCGTKVCARMCARAPIVRGVKYHRLFSGKINPPLQQRTHEAFLSNCLFNRVLQINFPFVILIPA